MENVINLPAISAMSAAERLAELMQPVIREVSEILSEEVGSETVAEIAARTGDDAQKVHERCALIALSLALCRFDMEAILPEARRMVAILEGTSERDAATAMRLQMRDKKKKPRQSKRRRG